VGDNEEDIMSRHRLFSWTTLVGIALAGVVAATALAGSTALASDAGSAASPFELVFTGRYEPYPECEVNPSDMCFDMKPAPGTFTAGAPFCDSGTTEDVGYTTHEYLGLGHVRRYTCADGSGSLALSISKPWAEYITGSTGEWAIIEGSGRYEGMHGKGSYTGELLSGPPLWCGCPADVSTPIVFRTRAQGVAVVDAGPPSLAFTSATATKLRRPAGEYLIRVSFALRDDVDGLPLAYRLDATEGPQRLVLDWTVGETASGSVSTTLRIDPVGKRLRTVDLRLRAWDWVGNEQLLVKSLRLPR
jgi:hypothetical protein